MNYVIHFLLVLLLAAACAPKPAVIMKGSFDLTGLIDTQVSAMSQRKVTLEKEAGVGGFKSDSTWVPTASGWADELAIFHQLGAVNKSIYQGSYQETGPMDDPSSNLLIKQYTSTTSPLRSLKVYYHESQDRVRKIEGVLVESNPLYATEKNLTLEFDEEDHKPVLTTFGIQGYQKVALRDTVRFFVQSTIHW